MIRIIGIKSLCYLGFNLCRIGFLKSSKIKLTLTCPFKVMPLKRVMIKTNWHHFISLSSSWWWNCTMAWSFQHSGHKINKTERKDLISLLLIIRKCKFLSVKQKKSNSRLVREFEHDIDVRCSEAGPLFKPVQNREMLGELWWMLLWRDAKFWLLFVLSSLL